MKDIYKQKQFTLSLDVIPHKKQVKKRAETLDYTFAKRK